MGLLLDLFWWCNPCKCDTWLYFLMLFFMVMHKLTFPFLSMHLAHHLQLHSKHHSWQLWHQLLFQLGSWQVCWPEIPEQRSWRHVKIVRCWKLNIFEIPNYDLSTSCKAAVQKWTLTIDDTFALEIYGQFVIFVLICHLWHTTSNVWIKTLQILCRNGKCNYSSIQMLLVTELVSWTKMSAFYYLQKLSNCMLIVCIYLSKMC